MKEIKSLAGNHISSVCQAAIKNGFPCFFIFNDIRVEHLSEYDTPESLEEDFMSACNKRRQEYLNSPRGKADAAKRARVANNKQQVVDSLMERMPQLDFSNQMEILTWFKELTNPSDDVDVQKPVAEILQFFEKNGYLPGVYCGKEFVASDKNIYARYLVGQALSCLKTVGAIHHMYHSMFETWKNKFEFE